MSTTNLKMSSNFKKTSDDAIIASMTKQNYHVALVLLGQLQHEQSKLSKENQVRFCECLLHIGRPLDALDNIRKFSEQGNTLHTLTFLKGCAYFQQLEYENAKSIFDQDPDWHRWSMKCQLMNENPIEKKKVINFGEPCIIPDSDKVEVITRQEGKFVILRFGLKGLTKDQINCTVLPFSLDIEINVWDKQYLRSFDFFDEILPKSIAITSTAEFLEIKLEKLENCQWKSVEKTPEELLGENDISLEKVLEALKGVPSYTDQEASELFEQSQLLVMGDPRKAQK